MTGRPSAIASAPAAEPALCVHPAVRSQPLADILAWFAAEAPWLRVGVRRMRRGFVHVRRIPGAMGGEGGIPRLVGVQMCAATVHPDLLLETDGPVSLLEWLCHPRSRTARDRLLQSIARCQARRADQAWTAHASWLADLTPVGPSPDLQAEADAVRAVSFADLPPPQVTWARQPPTRRLRHIRFGSYRSAEGGRIAISPRLAMPWVARSFLRHVLHHEFCHHRQACLKIQRREGVHSPRFRAWERAQPEYADAMRWESLALHWLLAGSDPPWIAQSGSHPP